LLHRNNINHLSLLDKINAATAHALTSDTIQTLATTTTTIKDGPLNFCIRRLDADASREKFESLQPNSNGSIKIETDPFNPYDENLFVTSLTDRHICLLNKYNVVKNHVLVITRNFEEQRMILTRPDCHASALCLADIPGLIFYNGGREAGASQKHKHLQFIPPSLSPGDDGLPVQSVINLDKNSQNVQVIKNLPYEHSAISIDPGMFDDPDIAGGILYDKYLKLANYCEVVPESAVLPDQKQLRPYNLLLTREWMMIIPRSRESWNGISVNSLGYAGGLLAKSDEEMEIIRKDGPFSVLTNVGFPVS
jgi:ATP adenylyltransferase